MKTVNVLARKALALMLVVAIALGSAVPVFAADNMTPNASFETDTADWVYFDNTKMEASTESAHEGSRALTLTKEKKGIKLVNAIKVTEGTTYKIGAWVNGPVSLISAVFKTDGTVEYLDHAAGGEKGKWTYLEGVIDVATGSKFDKVDITFTAEADKVLIDDVTFVKSGTSTTVIENKTTDLANQPKGDNLFPEPGFEKESQDWLLLTETPPSYSGTVVHSGAKAMNIPVGNGIKLLNRLGIEQGVTYELTAWVYGKVNLIAMMYDNADNPIDYYNAASPFMGGGEEGKWTQISGTFMTDDERVGKISIEFRAVGATDSHVDDISFRSCGVVVDTWEPTPSKEDVRLGCYYFNNWVSPEVWSSIKDFEEVDIEPVLGYYRDEDPKVQEWHIKQARQHDISFWVFDWYYDLTTDTILRNNAALDDGFLNASNCEEMDFALLWCNEEKDTSGYTEEKVMIMTQQICEKYLSKPNYLKTSDGENILVMTRPDRLIEVFGLQGTKSILKKMDQAAEPYGGFYFVGVKFPTEMDMKQLKACGFDATTLYSYNDQGMPAGAQEAPYAKVLPAVEPIIRAGDKADILPIIPMVSPRWDSRPWADLPGRGTWRSDATTEVFAEMCTTLRKYADPKLNMMFVGTWNEFGEGSYIEPTTLYGCDYLDAMQKALFPNSYKEHELLKPTDAEKESMVYKDIPPSNVAKEADGNLAINPSFERGYGWVAFGPGEIKYSNDCVDGEQSLVLTKDQKGLKCNNLIAIEPNVTYSISAWVKGDADMVCALFDKDGVWNNDYYKFDEAAQSRGSSDWVQLKGTFTNTDANVAFIDVEIANESESGADVLIDMIEVRDPSTANKDEGAKDESSAGASSTANGQITEPVVSGGGTNYTVIIVIIVAAAAVLAVLLLRKKAQAKAKTTEKTE